MADEVKFNEISLHSSENMTTNASINSTANSSVDNLNEDENNGNEALRVVLTVGDLNMNNMSDETVSDLISSMNEHRIEGEKSAFQSYADRHDSHSTNSNSSQSVSIIRSINASNNPSVQHRQEIVANKDSGIAIPIIGYEIMEERARFTIYKLRIDDPRTGLSWMVFRRYTDFVRLYSKLKSQYTTVNLPLPGKRRFKDNFDPRFLNDRIRGLQLFINAVIRNLLADVTVRDFFCLDEPPPICDSEPESLALFNALEDTVKSLKNQLRQKEETLAFYKKKVMYLEDKMKSCSSCNREGFADSQTPDPANR